MSESGPYRKPSKLVALRPPPPDAIDFTFFVVRCPRCTYKVPFPGDQMTWDDALGLFYFVCQRDNCENTYYMRAASDSGPWQAILRWWRRLRRRGARRGRP